MNKELTFLVSCLKQNSKYKWLDFVMGYDFANDYWNLFIDNCYEQAKELKVFSVRGIQSRTLLFSKTPLFEFSVNLITLTLPEYLKYIELQRNIFNLFLNSQKNKC